MSQYFFPTPDLPLKSAALSLYGSGVIVGCFYENNAWTFNGTALTQTAVSGIAGLATSGYTDIVAGASGDVWLLQNSGPFVHLSSGVGTVYALPLLTTYEGAAFVPSLTAPYAVSASGALYTTSGSGMVAVTGSFSGIPALGLEVSGTTLFTAFPAAATVGVMNLSTQYSGTSTTLAVPNSMAPTCLAASTSASAMAVGGIVFSTFSSGYQWLEAAPNLLTMAGVNTTGIVTTFGVSNGAWTINNAITGMGAPRFVTWAPNGTNLLTADPTNQRVGSFSYALGVLTFDYNLAVSGASALAVIGDSVHALVAQASLNSLQPIVNTGTWVASGTPLVVPNPQAIIQTSASGVVIGMTNGLRYATYGSGLWTLGVSGTLPFTPRYLDVDSQGNIYAAATSGASGILAVTTSGLAVTASGTWVGAASGMKLVTGQLVIGDPTVPCVRIFGNSTWTQQSSGLAPAGIDAIDMGINDIFLAGTASTLLFKFGGPYELLRAYSGQVSIYKNGAWVTNSLTASGIPTAMTFNASGQLDVATIQNNIVTMTVSGTIVGTSGITTLPGQSSGVSLGVSRLQWFGSHLYGTTGVNDSLVQTK